VTHIKLGGEKPAPVWI